MNKLIFPLIIAGFVLCSCDTCKQKHEANQNGKKQEYNTEKNTQMKNSNSKTKGTDNGAKKANGTTSQNVKKSVKRW